MGSFEQSERIVLDGCEVDVGQAELVRGAERHRLPTKELDVLRYLARNAGRPISHEELLEKVWGHSRLASTQPVYSVVKRLRRKLDGYGEHRHILTVHGLGYRFELPRASAIAAEPAPSSADDSLVGRSGERAAVQACWAEGARIVTLVGPGGVGKTRIARALGAEWAARGHDVCSCDLSAVATGADLPRALALAIGARPSAEDDADGTDPLRRALRSRGAWALVLDDAEHVLDALAPLVVALAPSVRVLVTSRERLGVLGERVIEVAPLSTREGEALFRARASAAGATLRPDASVAEVVARLEGLPLAIELAAAYAGVVSFERLQHELDRQIDHLVATRRGVPARHATLRSSVEWSWSLLDPREREVLAQCVVFAGGFTLEAAEAVIATAGAVRADLVRLRERSLLRVLGSATARGRLDLYQIVRELAGEHLVEREAVEERHAAWAQALVRASGALETPAPIDAYASLAPEIENLVAAFRRELLRDAERAGELALAIHFVATRAHGRGEDEVLRSALEVARGSTAVALRLALGRSLQQKGGEAAAFLEETIALARAEGTEAQALEAERLAAAALTAIGEPSAALVRLAVLLDRARAVEGATVLAGRIALDLAEAHLVSGSVDRAGVLGTEAARVLESAGDPIHAARAAGVLSHVHRERREHEDGLAALERARRLLEEAGDEVGLARLALDRGVSLAHLARSEEASEALAAAIAAHHRLGLVSGEIRARDWMVLALLGMGQDDAALAQARELQQLAIDLGRRTYEAERAFGATWLVTGRVDEAERAFGRALDILAARGTATVRGHVLSARALARILAGRLADAQADLESSARIHEARGSEAARLHALAELAIARELEGRGDHTDEALEDAARIAGSPWEARHAVGRSAIVAIVRARREGESGAAIARLRDEARAALLGGATRPTDYFTRCSLLLLDHVAR